MAGKVTIKKDSSLARVLAQRTGDWLGALVDEYLEKNQTQRQDPGWFHPSMLSNSCDAMLAFAYMGTEGKSFTKARIKRLFAHGHDAEARWQGYIRALGIAQCHTPEDRLIEIPHLKIRGELDNIVRNPHTQELYIWDCKTMNTDDWDKLRAPVPSHVIQMHPYMFAKGILQAMLTYENKNNQDAKHYTIRFDSKLWHSLEVRLLNIIEQVEKKKLPWRTPLLNDSQCQYYLGNETFSGCSAFSFSEDK